MLTTHVPGARCMAGLPFTRLLARLAARHAAAPSVAALRSLPRSAGFRVSGACSPARLAAAPGRPAAARRLHASAVVALGASPADLRAAAEHEQKKGYCNAEGKKLFANFGKLLHHFAQTSATPGGRDAAAWRGIAARAQTYDRLSVDERAVLVAECRSLVDVPPRPEPLWVSAAKPAEPLLPAPPLVAQQGPSLQPHAAFLPNSELKPVHIGGVPYLVVYFDFEATGVNAEKCRAIEVAVTEHDSGESFSTLIRPHSRIIVPDEVKDLTSITTEMLFAQDVPGFKLAAERMEAKIVAWCARRPGARVLMVAHNAKRYDAKLLRNEYERADRAVPGSWLCADSLPMVKSLYPGLDGGHGLDNLRVKRMLKGGPAHRAKADTHALRNLMLQLDESQLEKAMSMLLANALPL